MSLSEPALLFVKTQLVQLFNALQEKRVTDLFFQGEFIQIIDLYLQRFASIDERLLNLFDLASFLHINAERISEPNKSFVNDFIQNMEDRELQKTEERVVAAPSEEEDWRAFMNVLDDIQYNSTDLVIADVVVKKKDVFTLRAAFNRYFKTGDMKPLIPLMDQLAIAYQNRQVFEELCSKAAVGLSEDKKHRLSIIIAHMFKIVEASSNISLFKQYASI